MKKFVLFDMHIKFIKGGLQNGRQQEHRDH